MAGEVRGEPTGGRRGQGEEVVGGVGGVERIVPILELEFGSIEG